MPDNWRSVEIKHLRALGAIADTGTFWAASEQLNSSLSTVSDHVTALEALVGQRLIERSRGRRTVELTEAGRLLLGHADAIESRLGAAEADFRAYAAGRSGSLRIGIYQSVANKVLPEGMRRSPAGWAGWGGGGAGWPRGAGSRRPTGRCGSRSSWRGSRPESWLWCGIGTATGSRRSPPSWTQP